MTLNDVLRATEFYLGLFAAVVTSVAAAGVAVPVWLTVAAVSAATWSSARVGAKVAKKFIPPSTKDNLDA